VNVPDSIDFQKFLEQIDRNAELRGMRVVYFDGDRMSVVREGPPICAPGLRTVVIKPNDNTETLQHASAAAGRESRLYVELLGGALGCTSAVVSWLVVFGSGAAVPITGGASSFLTYLSVGAATTSSAQCGISLARIYFEMESPSTNDWLDSNENYSRLAKALDVISLLGAASSATATVRMALALRRTTSKTMISVIQGLSRQERARLAEEVIRMENPGISNGAVKAMLRAGLYPKRFTMLQVNHAVKTQLKDALSAALTFTGSGLSGVVHEYAAGIAQSFETY
jgi:hypothetical protein